VAADRDRDPLLHRPRLKRFVAEPIERHLDELRERAGGVAGELAGANAVRNPGRTASTAAALMIGLTLVTVVAVLGAGLSATTRQAVADQVRADHVIDGDEGLGFRASEGDALAGVPGVANVSHVRSDTALVQGEEGPISGIDPTTIADFYKFAWSAGSEDALGELGRDGAIVTEDYAEREELKVGARVAITTPAGDERALVVRGLYDPPQAKQLLGPISMTQQAFDEAFTQPKNSFTFIDADAAAAAPLEAAAQGFGDATYHAGADYPADATKEMATMLAMLYVLLGFSVIVSLFGMVNTMVLSVFERTREIGMLRTIGMTRRQARRMIRHESVITALIGAAMGLGLGLFLSGLITKAMSDYDLAFSVPVPVLVAFTLVAVLAGIGAAIMPARRASRLNVLDALQYE
jgi:putative ABC transport system permease protein